MPLQRGAPKRAICRGCRSIVSDWYPKSVDAELTDEVGLGLWICCDVTVIHAELWIQILRHCPSAVVGRVFRGAGESKKLAHEYVTVLFPPSEMVRVRGSWNNRAYNTEPSHRVCQRCGRQRYFAVNDPHLVRSQIPSGRLVFADWCNRLVIKKSLADVLDWSLFPDRELQPLPVFERPLDGLRLLDDPDWDALSGAAPPAIDSPPG